LLPSIEQTPDHKSNIHRLNPAMANGSQDRKEKNSWQHTGAVCIRLYTPGHFMPTLDLLLSNASGVPFYRQIVDQMADMVRAGTLEPGSRLASVRELALQLQVSLITVRRAYADLEAAGLIVRRQGQGTFVANDVGKAAAKQARTDAQTALEQAINRARQLGLEDHEIESIITHHIHATGGSHE
jgi:GntR family transcriptional regulator